tara:strand:- start:11743 stop:12735 length:993 start_codon:yes stop_codon:yes gene_type:complete
MAVLTDQYLTLLDMAKRTDPQGKIATVVEMLSQTNEILDDIGFKNGNLEVGHRTTIRTGLPKPTWRRFNEGVQPTKSKTAQVTFATGNMEMYTMVDKDLAELNGDVRAVMLSEDMATMEAMGQELATTIFYGSEGSNAASFNGLASYYDDMNEESGKNIVDAGGTGADNASIFLVGWAPNTIYGIVPKNSEAGMRSNYMGEVTHQEADGGKRQVYQGHHKLEAGLAVEDWRYGVRIANIDRSDLIAGNANAADLPSLIHTATIRMQSMMGVTPVLYMDRTVQEYLEKQVATQLSGSTLSYEDVGGRRTPMFKGIPIRRVDTLAVDEAQIT